MKIVIKVSVERYSTMNKLEVLTIEQKAEQFDKLMGLIREKISHSTKQKQLQLLTLAPETCSRETIADFFGVSEYLVRESRELFKKNVILAEIEGKKGKFLENN